MPVPWVVALLVVLGFPIVARGGPPCLPSCNPNERNNECCAVDPAFADACGNYLGLRAAAEEASKTGEVSDCISSSQRCQPASPGRCTIILGCVRRCRDNFGIPIPEKQLQREAFGSLTDCNGTPLNASGRRSAKRTCTRCAAGSVTTSTIVTTTSTSSSTQTTSTSTSTSTLGTAATTTHTTTTTRTPTTTAPGPPPDEQVGDPCFNACLNRLSSVRRCYRRCDSACEGDRRARNICRRSCRNGSCLAVKAKCTINENNQDQIDPEYIRCCNRSDDCRDAEEAECEVTTTSTSTTSTSSVTSSTGVTITSTTTSPPPTTLF